MGRDPRSPPVGAAGEQAESSGSVPHCFFSANRQAGVRIEHKTGPVVTSFPIRGRFCGFRPMPASIRFHLHSPRDRRQGEWPLMADFTRSPFSWERPVMAVSGLSWQRTLPTSAPLRFAVAGFFTI